MSPGTDFCDDTLNDLASCFHLSDFIALPTSQEVEVISEVRIGKRPYKRFCPYFLTLPIYEKMFKGGKVGITV